MSSSTQIQRAAWSLTGLLLLVALGLIFTATVQAAASVDGGWASADGELGREARVEGVQNRIGLIAGRMVEDMAKDGYFEMALTALWTHQDITFRNMGWPADDFFGTARSKFGSSLNTKSWQPSNDEKGFGCIIADEAFTKR